MLLEIPGDDGDFPSGVGAGRTATSPGPRDDREAPPEKGTLRFPLTFFTRLLFFATNPARTHTLNSGFQGDSLLSPARDSRSSGILTRNQNAETGSPGDTDREVWRQPTRASARVQRGRGRARTQGRGHGGRGGGGAESEGRVHRRRGTGWGEREGGPAVGGEQEGRAAVGGAQGGGGRAGSRSPGASGAAPWGQGETLRRRTPAEERGSDEGGVWGPPLS